MKKALLFLFIIFLIAIFFSLILTLTRTVPVGEKVAIVKIQGMILDSSHIIDELREYARDSSVKAIVIRIESPGGAVAPSQEIYEEIKKIKEKKYVVVSMGSVAASGGYYIASAAHKILANPGTLTGSIGVIMELPNISGLMKKIGIETQIIKSGKHKDLASVFKSLSPEERKILQSVLDDVHEQFIKAVAEGRQMSIEEVRKIADGRIFTGKMAKELGLIDEIGNLQDAITLAGKMSGIKGEPHIIEKKDRISLFDLLRGKIPSYLCGNSFNTISIKYLMM